MRIARPVLAAVAVAALLAGCGTRTATDAATTAAGTAAAETADTATVAEVATASVPQTVAEALAARQQPHVVDATWDAADVVDVTLDGPTASADGAGVLVADGTVTITEAGAYRLSGTLDGQVVVDTASTGTVRLILDGATITSSTTAAIAIVQADELAIILADGSQNALTDAAIYADTSTDAPNAALWSADDLTITGSGALTVTGSANDGIAAKDGLVIDGGTITVTAADDGIRGKDYLVVNGGTLTVDAGGHALKSDNADDATVGYVALLGGTIDLSSSGEDGVNAQAILVGEASVTIGVADDGMHADADMVIGGGTIAVTASYEALEASTLAISGGVLDLTSDDDGINIAGGADASGMAGPGGGDQFAADSDLWVDISGGAITIHAQGDGLDSGGNATMSGGTLVIHGPTGDGNGAIDVNGLFGVSGGTLAAGGSSGMAEVPESGSAQGWVSVTFSGIVAAGTTVELVDTDGTTVATYTGEKTFASVVFSTAGIASGAEYEVVVAGTSVGTVTAGEHVGGTGPGGGGPRG